MAFGYTRERGTGRGYVNAAGERLSRRQYDKLAEAQGARRHLPAQAPARTAQRAGQNVFNLNLEDFVRSRRAAGETINKRSARSDPRFKKIQAEWKGKPVRKTRSGKPNRNDVRANQKARERAVRALGMTMREWREQYEREEGRLVHRTRLVSRASRQGREGRGA